MTDISTATLREIVTDDFRAAAIFEKYSLDFCCRGGKTIAEACTDKDVDRESVLRDMRDLEERGGDRGVSEDLPAGQLTQHIVATHHAYVRRMVPVLLAHTRKVATVHGPNHPEVVDIAVIFEKVAAELLDHMLKEENVLFPYIEALGSALESGAPVPAAHFGTARNPIRMMEAEHRLAGDALYDIRKLSGTYAPPPDACTTFKVTYRELEEFERDLHRHVHLENNMLFPEAIALEDRLSR